MRKVANEWPVRQIGSTLSELYSSPGPTLTLAKIVARPYGVKHLRKVREKLFMEPSPGIGRLRKVPNDFFFFFRCFLYDLYQFLFGASSVFFFCWIKISLFSLSLCPYFSNICRVYLTQVIHFQFTYGAYFWYTLKFSRIFDEQFFPIHFEHWFSC